MGGWTRWGCLVGCLLWLAPPPAGADIRDSVEAGLLLADLLRQDARPLLAELADEPAVQPIRLQQAEGPAALADLYCPARDTADIGLLVVHGLTVNGRQDSRLQRLGRLTGLAGLPTLIPDFPQLMALTPGEDTAEEVVQAALALLQHLGPERDLAILAFSFGAGPALSAASDPRIRDRVALFIGFGGYGRLEACLKFATCGVARHGRVRIEREPLPFGREALEKTLQAMGAAEDSLAARLVQTRDPEEFDRLYAALPARLLARVEALTPLSSGRVPSAPVILLHARHDPLIPFTETLYLADQLTEAGRLEDAVILESFDHVNPLEDLTELGRGTRDLAALHRTLKRLLELR